MSRPTLTLFFVTMFLAVFLQVSVEWPRRLLHAQVNLLPALIVYVALTADVWILFLAALVGGLWFDSMSLNPLGASILPLYLVGLFIQARREVILRELTYAQLVVGLAASAVVPVLTLLILLTVRAEPILGLATLWQWAVMAAGGALATPVFFAIFDRLEDSFTFPTMATAAETLVREDREIKRGRRT